MARARRLGFWVVVVLTAALFASDSAGAVDETVAAVGDITTCSSTLDDASASAASWSNPVGILTLGDNAYNDGSLSDFNNCWAGSTWRWQTFRVYPSPGNHEYGTSGAAGYFNFFAGQGRPTGRERGGYYSFNIGSWHIVSLNSEIDHSATSPQATWLKNDLQADTHKCELLYWHRPLFSSGQHGNQADVKPLWDIAYQQGVDLILNGHDHEYEQFRAQNPVGGFESGDPGVGRGITEFVVGTGGASRYSFSTIRSNSAQRHVGEGVLLLYLHDVWAGWKWQSAGTGGDWWAGYGSQWCHS